MLKNFVKLFPLRGPFDKLRTALRNSDLTKKTVEQYGDLVEQVNGLEAEYEAGKAEEFSRVKIYGVLIHRFWQIYGVGLCWLYVHTSL